MLDTGQMAELAEPFPVEAVQWKPGATNQEKTRALALAYVDLRHYIDRLNEVAGPDWGDDYEVQDGGKVVVCRLTVGGVTRSDVGEAPVGDENTATSALAQAFKRACVKFGLGAYLYRLPREWVPYDGQRKRITDEGLAALQRKLRGQQGNPSPSGNGNGAGRAPEAGLPDEKFNSPQKLLAAVNEHTNGYYGDALPHLLNAIKVELGNPTWIWPMPKMAEAWRDAGNAAVAHARKAAA